jgi:hypothetical protein
MRRRSICRRDLVLVISMCMICIITRELRFGAHRAIDIWITNDIG